MQPAQPQKLTPIRKTYIWGTEDWMLSWFNEGLEDIPLLIKIIKAREALSVQVHPGNTFAREKEQKSGDQPVAAAGQQGVHTDRTTRTVR